jgi:uncharacterized protein (TIGR00251 family)
LSASTRLPRRNAERAAVELTVRVIPRARKTEISGERDGALVVRVAAPPVDGAANDALIAFFSDALRVPRRAVQIVSGERGRLKRIAIAGVTEAHIRALIAVA